MLEDHIDLSTPSLFAMADIHGDYPRAQAALVHAGVVDESGNWKAGNATFVCGNPPRLPTRLTYYRSKQETWWIEALIRKSSIDG